MVLSEPGRHVQSLCVVVRKERFSPSMPWEERTRQGTLMGYY